MQKLIEQFIHTEFQHLYYTIKELLIDLGELNEINTARSLQHIDLLVELRKQNPEMTEIKFLRTLREEIQGEFKYDENQLIFLGQLINNNYIGYMNYAEMFNEACNRYLIDGDLKKLGDALGGEILDFTDGDEPNDFGDISWK